MRNDLQIRKYQNGVVSIAVEINYKLFRVDFHDKHLFTCYLDNNQVGLSDLPTVFHDVFSDMLEHRKLMDLPIN